MYFTIQFKHPHRGSINHQSITDKKRNSNLVVSLVLPFIFKGILKKQGWWGGGVLSREHSGPWIRGTGSSKAGRNIKHIWRGGNLPRMLSLFFFMRNTLYSRTWPLSPLPERKRSRQCTGRCISCVCCGGGCSRCLVLLLPPGSCPDTLDGRPSPGFGTPRSLAVSGRHLGPVPLGRPPLQAWGGNREVRIDPHFQLC